MPTHYWGDETFDWNGLHDAIQYIHINLEKYGRIGVHSKEKYGTARIDVYFAYDFHSLTHPGYVYCQYPKWLWTLDIYYGKAILKWTGLAFLIRKWQKIVYVEVYRKALLNWPHLKAEIVSHASHIELLEEAGLCRISDYWTTL